MTCVHDLYRPLDLQHRLLREPSRFVEDVRVAADGQVQARVWSPDLHCKVWTSVELPSWLSLGAALAAAANGRLLARPGRLQRVLALERKEAADGRR
jgi:hypothetical protein